ncbi:MAG: NUDIX domain-containing protein [Candidatus Woesearchaeota archaeon]
MSDEKYKMIVAVDIVLFTIKENDLKVLLIKRLHDPFKEMWAIPGGRVEQNESLKAAAERELSEEVNVKVDYLEQLYTFGEPQRDPRGRVISVVYYALVSSDNIKPMAGSDAKEFRWHSMFKLPKLAFDHKEILDYALQRLRYKLGYTTVGFELLQEKFTLTELQKMYETILDKQLDKRNFRKKIFSLDIVNPTLDSRMEGPHRPAKLYTFKKKYLTFSSDIV